MAIRTAEEVLEEHLALWASGDVELDLCGNYAEDARILCRDGVWWGHDGVRELVKKLHARVPELRLRSVRRVMDGELVLVEWTAEGRGVHVPDGADTLVIRDGLIRAQTVHYTVVLLAG